ncbi:MAG TPA: hypothetical protein VI583_07490 [Cyclobacteriaceae bacterium]|nr:hypothetical protein [Cyclobacteriaceae bacterium]
MKGQLSCFHFILLFFLLFLPVAGLIAQDGEQEPVTYKISEADSVLNAIFTEDSLSFLNILDSLLTLKMNISVFSARLGYISSITNAGRNFGVSQYGISGGVSYYHNSGFYADMNLYWNSDLSPAINPLVTSVGYMGSIKSRFSYSASYEHYFYFKSDDSVQYYYPLTNGISLSPYFDTKWISLGADYSFLFGKKTAHRIRPNIHGNIVFKTKGIIDRLRIAPGASMLIGNQDIVSQNPVNIDIAGFIQSNGQGRYNALYKKYGDKLFEYLYSEEITNEFGIMNYTLSLPASIMAGNFTLSISYYYNMPVALPGESISLDPNSYFSVNLIYSLPMIKYRKSG